ncbi:MAG: hypothetical protein CMO34_03080 [Verrucomicrobia bacterium]|nr:hypothetical protein [Verrucomicrobiota bacterium]
MKKSVLTITIATAFFFTSSVILSSCEGEQKQKTEEHEHAEGNEHENMEQGHEHDAMEEDSSLNMTHACPMHPEVKGKEGDHCSKCDMALEVISVSKPK